MLAYPAWCKQPKAWALVDQLSWSSLTHIYSRSCTDPQSAQGVLAWIREREQPLEVLPREGLRIARAFNQCVMAAELVAAASRGALTVSKAMHYLRPRTQPALQGPTRQIGSEPWPAKRSRADAPGRW